MHCKASRFSAEIDIVGVNPFVHPPAWLLEQLFAESGRSKGPIPISLTVGGATFPQTLVKFAGSWRLYLNGPMLRAAGKVVGDQIVLVVGYDPVERVHPLRPELRSALEANPAAKAVFDGLPASRRKEIVRYLAALKGKEAVARNVERAILFLEGKCRFIGRDCP